jgi:phosphopantothenoylcysteine decarboxylase/phosphopantothenate--cysteine ligase
MKVLLGVTGGIAAYKSAEIVRAFIKRGDEVRVVMTSSAQEFITPMTLQVLSEQPVGTDLFDPRYESEIGHIDLARWADVVLIAPATANAIARIAHGMADDLMTTVITATTSPVVVAPAMNTQMYRNALVQRNLATLEEVGIHVVDPDQGELACKEVGPGRLPDAHVLVDEVERAGTPQLLAGKRVIVTAGPTREHLDPARFISNPSTGKMGFAIARAARIFGAEVTLVTGVSSLLTPYGVRRVDIESAQEMHDEVMARVDDADYIVKAAAVADWRPADRSEHKRAKGDTSPTLELERTPDILATLGEKYEDAEDRPYIVGFAAESRDVMERGREKLDRKRVDMIVANKIGGDGDTFGSDDVRVCLITHDGAEWLDRQSKEAVAGRIWKRAVEEATR